MVYLARQTLLNPGFGLLTSLLRQLLQAPWSVHAKGLRNLKTPFGAPQVNSSSERLVGSILRACLDLLIPLNKHLRCCK